MDANRWGNVLDARRAYEAGSPVTGKAPLEAFFEVAARCNLHCQMCAINYDSRYLPGSKRPPFLTPELFARLEPMFPRLVRAYLFGLGEPLLNRHLIDYIRTLSGYGVEVWFNTNATLIDDAKAEALAEAGAGAITVSIDGATKETYERIRIGASHEAVLRGIRALVRAARIHGRPRVDLSFVGMASNLHELPQLVDFAAEVGAGGVHVEPLYSQIQHDLQEHYARENLGLLGTARVHELFETAKSRAAERGVHLASRFLSGGGSTDYVERAKQLDIWWTCNEPWTSIWVTSAGEVRTCCLNDTSFGNLFEKEFRDIWNGSSYQEFRSEHAAGQGGPESCRNCVRNGRVRHSPFLAALEPVTYRPLREPGHSPVGPISSSAAAPSIAWPHEGDVVTDPIAILGTWPGTFDFEIVIDRNLRIPLARCGIRQGNRFVATLDLPFLTEGAHLLSLRIPGDVEDISLRTIHVWTPPPTASTGSLRATSAAVMGRRLDRRVKRAHVEIDGRSWRAAEWICAESDAGWLGFTWVDLEELPAGLHRIVVEPARQAPATYTVERLPSTLP